MKILTAVAAAAAVMAYGFDGPFWLLSVPGGTDSEVRWAIARMHSWRGSTRASAASLLQMLGPAAAPAAPILVEHLDDFGWADGWRRGLAQSFSFHGGPDYVMNHAGGALSGMGARAVPALISGVEHGREGVRAYAAELLGRSADARAAPALRAALAHDPSSRVQTAAVRTLGRMGDSEALEIVTNRLHDSDPRRRAQAALLLEHFHSQGALEALQGALTDPEANVRECAAAAMHRMTLLQ